jgi:Opioid growth factor receptor (OGFr) conserved region
VAVCVLFCRGIRAFQLLGFSRFPIREKGVNYDSQRLQKHEIESMKADSIILERVIKSYQLMLDFYGMHLVSKETGLVDRVLPPRNFAPRYFNFVRE